MKSCIYIGDPVGNAPTMLYVRVSLHQGHWLVFEGLTNR